MSARPIKSFALVLTLGCNFYLDLIPHVCDLTQKLLNFTDWWHHAGFGLIVFLLWNVVCITDSLFCERLMTRYCQKSESSPIFGGSLRVTLVVDFFCPNIFCRQWGPTKAIYCGVKVDGVVILLGGGVDTWPLFCELLNWEVGSKKLKFSLPLSFTPRSHQTSHLVKLPLPDILIFWYFGRCTSPQTLSELGHAGANALSHRSILWT